jgi:hypothetical protein
MLTPARPARVLLPLPSHGRVDADHRTEKEQQNMLSECTTHAWMYRLWVRIPLIAGGAIHLHLHSVDRAINDRAVNDRANICRAIIDSAIILLLKATLLICKSAEL